MAASLEETLTSVWRQALVEESRSVLLDKRSFPVRRTSRARSREVDFHFEGHRLRGLEQNPETSSRWAQLARQGKKVMQFLEHRRYVAVVVDGGVHFYGRQVRDQLEQHLEKAFADGYLQAKKRAALHSLSRFQLVQLLLELFQFLPRLAQLPFGRQPLIICQVTGSSPDQRFQIVTELAGGRR